MGWKASAIIINALNEETNVEEILNSIGYRGLQKIEDKAFDAAIYPDEGTVYIGIYKGNLIITAPDLPLYFVDQDFNEIEKRITGLFPEAEICALSLNSGINHWTFAVMDKGKIIRIRGGDRDQGTLFDFGQPLEQELELLSRARVNSRGEREYLSERSGEFYEEHQVGEEFVFEVVKRYTGERLDTDDELLETIFFGYRYQSFAGPNLMDSMFCGEWSGYYSYGQGYREAIKGTRGYFSIKMEVENGALKGTSKEADKEAANINGYITDNFIGFIHQYPVRYRFNEKGESIADPSAPGSKIYYTGLFDERTNSFRGIWRIDGRDNWGEWIMKKQGGG